MQRRVSCLVVGAVVALLSVPAFAADDARLIEAVRGRDAAAVRALLKTKVDVNAPWRDGATALHWAAEWDDTEIAKALIAAGAKVGVVNDYGVAPLSLAATNGSAAMITVLLDAGADVNTALPTGETVLMTASRTGKVEAVKALAARGAQVNAKDPKHQQTALMWAVSAEHLDVVNALLKGGADIHARSATGFTPVMFAARQGNIEMMRALLAAGANVNDADKGGSSVLLVATIRGHAKLAEFLLQQGADPNAAGTGYTPLHWASIKVELNEFPTRYGPWNEWGVLGGVANGRMDLIRALLAHGADPNAQNTKNLPQFSIEGGVYEAAPGVTPLFLAAGYGDIETMKLLLAHGADPFVRNTDGKTVLMHAVGKPSGAAQDATPEDKALEAVKLAWSLGIDVNATEEYGSHRHESPGDTAVHLASYMGYNKIIQFLYDKGADINIKDKMGDTPLGITRGVTRGVIFFSGKTETRELLRKLGGVE